MSTTTLPTEADLLSAKRGRFAGNCGHCGVWRPSLHREHIIPVSQGGTEHWSNIQRLCANCHQDKTERDLYGSCIPASGGTHALKSAEFYAYLAQNRQRVSDDPELVARYQQFLESRDTDEEIAEQKLWDAHHKYCQTRGLTPEYCTHYFSRRKQESNLRDLTNHERQVLFTSLGNPLICTLPEIRAHFETSREPLIALGLDVDRISRVFSSSISHSGKRIAPDYTRIPKPKTGKKWRLGERFHLVLYAASFLNEEEQLDAAQHYADLCNAFLRSSE